MALPGDVELDLIDWVPTRGEKEADQRRKTAQHRLEYLEALKREWDRRELLALERKAAELALVVAKDREFVARMNAMEEQDKWYLKQLEQERPQMTRLLAQMQEELDAPRYKALLACCEKAGKEIARDRARVEREELTRRGVYRGR